MGGYEISEPSETATRQIYKGEENPITLTRFYNTRYLLAYIPLSSGSISWHKQKKLTKPNAL